MENTLADTLEFLSTDMEGIPAVAHKCIFNFTKLGFTIPDDEQVQGTLNDLLQDVSAMVECDRDTREILGLTWAREEGSAGVGTSGTLQRSLVDCGVLVPIGDAEEP